MWTVFYSVIGNNEHGLSDCIQMRQIMNKVKHKYQGLDKDVSLDSLCGNKYWHNEITVTKYLCGITILNNMPVLVERKRAREKAPNQDNAAKKEGDSEKEGSASEQEAKRKKIKESKKSQKNLMSRFYSAAFKDPNSK